MEIVNDPEPPEQVPSGSDHPTCNTNDALTPELYFLIANALSTGPLAHLGVEIARQASQRGLLPSRLDFQGRRHPLSLSELRRRHPHLGPDALALAVSQLLQHRQQEDARAPWRKLTSILDPAVLPGPSALPSLPGFAAVPPRWALPPASSKHGGAGLLPPRLSLLKETAAAPFVPGTHIFTPATFAAKTDRHWTVRGHTNAAYCVVVDPTNRYIVTGSDDHLVKVWSTRTALLLRTCRGHSQEVTDLAVAPDGSLFASASMDGTIRVWMMDGRNEVKEENDDEDVFHLGTPVCVLQGHNSCVTFIEFCPTAPHVLVSSGFDGICRVWDARDGSAPPMILQCNQARPGAMALNFSHDHDMRVTRHADRRYGGGGGDAPGPSTGTHARATAAGPSNQRRQQQQQPPAGRGARRRTRRGSHDSDADFVPSDGGVDGEDRSEDYDEDLHHHHAVRGSGGDPVSLVDEQAHQEEEEEEHPAGEVQTAETPQLLTCGFSRDGRYVMAGSSDCCVYLWRLSVPEGETGTSTQQFKGPFSKGTPLGKERRRSWGPPHDWPEVEELIRLDGHRNDVYLLQFSRNGATLASGSKDGTVRLWRRPKRLRRSGRRPNWTLEATLACPVDEEAITLARQRRRTVPPPRVDQLAFTADDARIVVSFQDLAVHVFGVPSGKHLHALSKVHAEPIHVLMCHPFDPALAVSASYAGEVALLDVVQGKKLKGFDSRYSRPDGRPWPEGDSLPYVDGFMRPDGMSFVLTDAAGQLHCFGLGTRCGLTTRAPYDQFLSTDYEALMWDAEGNAASLEAGMSAHVPTGRESLCDITGNPYPLPFQQAYKQKHLLSVSAAEAAWRQHGTQPGYMLAPPTLSVAVWRAYLAGGSEVSAQNAAARASARLEQQERTLDALERARALTANASAAIAAGAPRVSGGARGSNGVDRAALGDHQQARERRRQRTVFGDNAVVEYVDLSEVDLSDSDDSALYYQDGTEHRGDGTAGGREGRRARRVGLRHSERLASRHPSATPLLFGEEDDANGPATRQASGRPSAASLREMQRRQREERARRREAAHEADMEQRRQRRRHRAARASARLRRGDRRDDEDDDEGGEEEEEEDAYAGFFTDEDGDGLGLEATDSEDENYSGLSLEDEEGEEEGDEAYRESSRHEQHRRADGTSRPEGRGGGGGGRAAIGGGGGSRRSTRRRAAAQRPQVAKAPSRKRRKTKNSSQQHHRHPPPSSSAAAAAAAGPRPSSAYSWLHSPKFLVAEYVPQLGDEVVYLREGHEAALTASSDKRPPPWQALPRGRTLRPAEPCIVNAVEYVIADNGTDATIARLSLRLVDPSSPLCNRTFSADVPSPASGQPEFVVLKSRYDIAVRHVWAVGDRCYSYWQASLPGPDGTPSGEWWVGILEGDKRAESGASSAGVLADPYGCGGLWERYSIRWLGTVDTSTHQKQQEQHSLEYPNRDDGINVGAGPSTSAAAAAVASPLIINPLRDTVDISSHSPWELFQSPGDAQPRACNEPSLDARVTTVAEEALEIAAAQDPWSIFQAAPEWDEAYKSVSGRREYYNRRVPLPLGLSDVAARLHLRYYRRHRALQHDVETIAANAALFNGPTSDIALDARAMAKYLLDTISNYSAAEGASPASGGDAAVLLNVDDYVSLPEREREEQERQRESERKGRRRGANEYYYGRELQDAVHEEEEEDDDFYDDSDVEEEKPRGGGGRNLRARKRDGIGGGGAAAAAGTKRRAPRYEEGEIDDDDPDNDDDDDDDYYEYDQARHGSTTRRSKRVRRRRDTTTENARDRRYGLRASRREVSYLEMLEGENNSDGMQRRGRGAASRSPPSDAANPPMHHGHATRRAREREEEAVVAASLGDANAVGAGLDVRQREGSAEEWECDANEEDASPPPPPPPPPPSGGVNTRIVLRIPPRA